MRFPRRDTSNYPHVWVPGQTSAMMLLLTVLLGWAAAQVVLWGLDGVAITEGSSKQLQELFRVDRYFISEQRYWAPLTYALIHTNEYHFLINVAVLYFAGREVEPIIGRRQFLAMTLVAWVVGGFASWAVNIGGFDADTDVVGFSASAAAILAAYSTIMPELEQRLNVFFIIPLRFRAKFFALAIVSLATVCLFYKTPSMIGPAGILAGCVIGWAWVKQLGFGNPLWIQRLVFDRRQRESRRDRMSAEDFVALEVDPILDKITRSGLQSLSRGEWKVLRQGRGKLEDKPERS